LPPSAASDGRTSGPPSSAKAKDKSLFHHQVAAEAIKELEINTNPQSAEEHLASNLKRQG